MRRAWASAARYVPSWGVSATSLLALLAACSGSPFSSGSNEPCGDDGCAGESIDSGGKLGSGGKVGSGGKTSSGGVGGGVMVGGVAGLGGSSSGSGGVTSGGPSNGGGGSAPGHMEFPTTQVLDDFNRVGPAVGLDWLHAADNYSLREQMLFCESCGSAALWATPFGRNQEVFAKLAQFDAGAAEINLVLKAQSSPDCDLIEVLYAPVNSTVRIDYCTAGVWTGLGVTPVTITPGDRLGARAHADGTIEIYVNQRLITTIDASSFPFDEGRLGVNGISAGNGNSWDDFGGGDWL